MYCVHSSDRSAHYNSRKKQLHSKLASEGSLIYWLRSWMRYVHNSRKTNYIWWKASIQLSSKRRGYWMHAFVLHVLQFLCKVRSNFTLKINSTYLWLIEYKVRTQLNFFAYIVSLCSYYRQKISMFIWESLRVHKDKVASMQYQSFVLTEIGSCG